MTQQTEETVVVCRPPPERRKAAPAVRFGVWAATLIDPDYWTLTHVPTGLGLGQMDRARAVEAARRLDAALPGWGSGRAIGDTTEGTAEDADIIRGIIADASLAVTWVNRLAVSVSEAIHDLGSRGEGDVSIAMIGGVWVVVVDGRRFESTSLTEVLADARRARDAMPLPPEVTDAP